MLHYDSSVRSSTGDVIQFEYGADTLDPAMIEGKDNVVDFHRVLEMTKALHRCADERAESPETLMTMAESIISEQTFHVGVKEYFIEQLREFMRKLTQNIRRAWDKFKITEETPAIFKAPWRLTKTQLEQFLNTCRSKYLRAKVTLSSLL